ncbi:MAG: glycine/sarcosine/betaine reductase selenoprotein B family protein [Actinomycetota bacterium]
MVRLGDLHASEAEFIRGLADAMRPLDPAPWIEPPPLVDTTVAIVSTAGLHRRDDARFTPGAVDYRLLPADVDVGDLVVSHVSTNFDRSAYQQDPNIWFPIDRLRELAEAGEIGGVASWHYSFMGAQPNHEALAVTGEEVGRLLAADGVDVVLLVPV